MVRDEKKIAVRFIMKNAPYNIGEIAGFPKAIADNMIAKKRAVLYVPDADDALAGPDSGAGDAVPVEEPKAASSPPELVVPIHDKGPYFMVGDERVKGKAKAQHLANKLNELNAAAEG